MVGHLWVGGENSARVRRALMKYLYEQSIDVFANIIDVGCGDLKTLKILRDERGFRNLTGLDVASPEGKGIYVINQNLNSVRWGVESGHYDVVLSTSVIEHLENPYHFLREIARIAKKGAFIIISTHRVEDWYSRLVFLKNGWLNNFKFPEDTRHPYEAEFEGTKHYCPVHKDQLVFAGRRAGLVFVEFFYDERKREVFVVFRKGDGGGCER